MKNEKYIYAPYILGEHSKKSSKEYDKFMKQYDLEHKCCPKCGSEKHVTTLVGYPLDMDKKEEYKDLNSCVCSVCGDKHSIHDRLSI